MKSLAQRDQQVIWHPYTQMQREPLARAIVKAEGSLLYSEDGEAIIDCSASWWTNLHGHAHPHIAKRIAEQAQCLDHVIFAGFTHEPAVALAERILDQLGRQHSRVFFSDNGSTAVEAAIKMALQFWANKGEQRRLVVALADAYHGDTFGAMSSSARSAFNAPYSELLFPVEFISKDEAGLERFSNIVQDSPPAALIFEPLIQAAAGMKIYSKDFLKRLVDIASRNSIITIADEVFTGFGRCEAMFACELAGIEPDIICLAKGLSGGVLPLGATTCKEYIYSAFLDDSRLKMFFHGHSFTANPIACAAALASLDLLQSEECRRARRFLAERQLELCAKLQNHPRVQQARCLGTIAAIELKTPRGEPGYFYAQRDFCYDYCLKRGVLVRPLGNVLPIVAPYCLKPQEWEVVSSVLAGCLDQIAD